jgi:hypothetical protein
MRCDAMRGVVRYVVRCVNEAMMMVLSVWVANEAEKPWPYIDVSGGETTFIRRLELRVKKVKVKVTSTYLGEMVESMPGVLYECK